MRCFIRVFSRGGALEPRGWIGSALTIPIMTLAVLLVISVGVSPLVAQPDGPLTYSYLWDPYSPDLAEWQMLGRGAGVAEMIAWGEPGQLFLIDREKAHILHLTREGDLIQIIGRSGQGPGEFTAPEALDFEDQTKTLWVLDGDLRCTRFVLRDGKYSYVDRFLAPLNWRASFRPNLVVESANRFWGTGRSLRATAQLDEARGDGRIKLVDVQEGITREFGPYWEPEAGSAWATLLAPGMQNAGYLVELGESRLSWTWMYRPRIEIWNTNGELLIQRELDGVTVPPPKSLGQNRVIAPPAMGKPAYEPVRDLLFYRMSAEGGTKLVGLDADSLQVREEYFLPIPGLDPRPDEGLGGIELSDIEKLGLLPAQVLVERLNGEVRFYAVDIITGTLMVMYPDRGPD